MYRSWAYILMAVATLAGVVALLWPSPTARTIGEISVPAARSTPPRPEAPAKPAKAPAKAPARPAAPPAPAVVKKIPAQNTTTRRAAPVLENGLQPNMFGNPAADRSDVGVPGAANPPPPRPGAAPGARPAQPPPPPPVPPAGGAAPSPEGK